MLTRQKLEDTTARLLKKLGRQPTRQQILDILRVSPATYYRAKRMPLEPPKPPPPQAKTWKTRKAPLPKPPPPDTHEPVNTDDAEREKLMAFLESVGLETIRPPLISIHEEMRATPGVEAITLTRDGEVTVRRTIAAHLKLR